MDIEKEREAFEEKFPIPAHWIEFDKKRNKYFCPYCADAAASAYQSQWETWQAKAQAVPEGYKVVPVNYECVWCGCTELDGWADETTIEAQEPTND